MSLSAGASSVGDAAQTGEQLHAFTESFQSKALQIIYEKIPLKIEALQAILTKFKAIECDQPIFTPTGAQCNQSVIDLMSPIKVEIHDLLCYVDPLRMWVSLNIPRIQDQKGTAVSVKEDLVEMLHAGKVSALGLMESMCKYFVARGKLVSKRVKFPLGQKDHDAAIQQLDEKQYYMLLNMVNDIKNNYSLIYDMVLKNMDKVVKAQDLDNWSNMF